MVFQKNGASLFKLPACPGTLDAFFNLEVFGVVLGWYAFQALLALIPLGPLVKGQPIASQNGRRLDYRCNGGCLFSRYVIY